MDQVVPLNVSEEEEKGMREAMEERRKQARLAKVCTCIITKYGSGWPWFRVYDHTFGPSLSV